MKGHGLGRGPVCGFLGKKNGDRRFTAKQLQNLIKLLSVELDRVII